jgi:hypothetical protein
MYLAAMCGSIIIVLSVSQNVNAVQAEAWLRDRAQKEGWAKASKLHSRPMSQGLIGIVTQEKAAAIVEVGHGAVFARILLGDVPGHIRFTVVIAECVVS